MYLFLLLRKKVLRYALMALSCYQSSTQTWILHLTGQNLIIWLNPATRETDHIALTNKISAKINRKQRIDTGWQLALYTKPHKISPNSMILLSLSNYLPFKSQLNFQISYKTLYSPTSCKIDYSTHFLIQTYLTTEEIALHLYIYTILSP